LRGKWRKGTKWEGNWVERRVEGECPDCGTGLVLADLVAASVMRAEFENHIAGTVAAITGSEPGAEKLPQRPILIGTLGAMVGVCGFTYW
jgi:hypothetical protein